jgi:hypothetical protein
MMLTVAISCVNDYVSGRLHKSKALQEREKRNQTQMACYIYFSGKGQMVAKGCGLRFALWLRLLPCADVQSSHAFFQHTIRCYSQEAKQKCCGNLIQTTSLSQATTFDDKEERAAGKSSRSSQDPLRAEDETISPDHNPFLDAEPE